MTPQLRLQPHSPGIYRVLTDTGLHVGNLKQIGGIWKFKAIGYDGPGQVIPGGGPLTYRHNTAFTTLDEVEVSLALLIK